MLVVGAMARDLILVHGYNARIERGTRDVDFEQNQSSAMFVVMTRMLSRKMIKESLLTKGATGSSILEF